MIKYMIAAAILLVWGWVALSYAWNPKYSFLMNLFTGLLTILLIGAVYWVPFWLIFLK